MDELLLDPLVHGLEAAVARGGASNPSAEVERELRALAAAGALALPERLMRPCETSYARHLVHLDPVGRYSALAMVWGPGQGTPLHDHDGLWGVEIVVAGEIEAEMYRHCGTDLDGAERFERLSVDRGGPGATGTLAPPLEYHTMRNPSASEKAVTLHVYGGELTRCRVFHPLGDGRYRAEPRRLALSE